MRKDKHIAFELRKSGKTYREIEKELGASRSTLSGWFKDKSWSLEVKRDNSSLQIKVNTEKLIKMNSARKIMLENKYNNAEMEAEKEFVEFRKNPLFMAGIMAYAGEGDKASRHLVRISNSEFYIHRVFIGFAEKFLDFKKENIKIALTLYPDLNIDECMTKWHNETGIPLQNFHKSQVILGKEKVKKLQYGVASSIICSTSLKKKVLKWLYLCKISL